MQRMLEKHTLIFSYLINRIFYPIQHRLGDDYTDCAYMMENCSDMMTWPLLLIGKKPFCSFSLSLLIQYYVQPAGALVWREPRI